LKLTIYKYNAPSDEFRQNYFDNQITFADKLVITRFLFDSFPVYREEWHEEDNVNVIKTGYFDMKLPLSLSEKSANGNTVLEFFENVSGTISRYKYLAVLESILPERAEAPTRTQAGIIDVNTLRTEESPQQGQWHLYFSVTGIEAEVVAYMKSAATPRLLTSLLFETSYLPKLLEQTLGIKLTLQSKLDIANKTNVPLIVDKITHNNFLDKNPGYLIWSTFRSFLLGYGFRFKVVYTGVVHLNMFPQFKLVVFFRTDGINRVTLSKYIKFQRSVSFYGNKYVGIFYTERPDANNNNITHYTGFVADRTSIFYSSGSNDILFDQTSRKYYTANYSLQLHESEITVVEIERKESLGSVFQTPVAICRCVNNAGYDALIRWTANVEVGYLLKGLKSKRSITFKAPEGLAVSLNSATELDGTSYILERINSYNPYTQTMEAEWVQS
jgi:hypothetical protein